MGNFEKREPPMARCDDGRGRGQQAWEPGSRELEGCSARIPVTGDRAGLGAGLQGSPRTTPPASLQTAPPASLLPAAGSCLPGPCLDWGRPL